MAKIYVFYFKLEFEFLPQLAFGVFKISQSMKSIKETTLRLEDAEQILRIQNVEDAVWKIVPLIYWGSFF